MTAESYNINTNSGPKVEQTIFLNSGDYTERELIFILRKLHGLNMHKPVVVEAGTEVASSQQVVEDQIIVEDKPVEVIFEQDSSNLIKLFSDFLASIRGK